MVNCFCFNLIVFMVAFILANDFLIAQEDGSSHSLYEKTRIKIKGSREIERYWKKVPKNCTIHYCRDDWNCQNGYTCQNFICHKNPLPDDSTVEWGNRQANKKYDCCYVFRRKKISTIEMCMSICERNTKCKGITYRWDDGVYNCMGHSKLNGPIPENDHTAIEIITRRVQPPPGNQIRWGNKQIDQKYDCCYVFRKRNVWSINQCKSLCEQNRKCLGITYRTDNGYYNCVGHSKLNGPIREYNHIAISIIFRPDTLTNTTHEPNITWSTPRPTWHPSTRSTVAWQPTLSPTPPPTWRTSTRWTTPTTTSIWTTYPPPSPPPPRGIWGPAQHDMMYDGAFTFGESGVTSLVACKKFCEAQSSCLAITYKPLETMFNCLGYSTLIGPIRKTNHIAVAKSSNHGGGGHVERKSWSTPHYNYIFNGNALFKLNHISSIEQCKRECEKKPTCLAITFRQDSSFQNCIAFETKPCLVKKSNHVSVAVKRYPITVNVRNDGIDNGYYGGGNGGGQPCCQRIVIQACSRG